MNTEVCDRIIDVRCSEHHQTIPSSSERTANTVLLYSPKMDMCVSLQIAFEGQYNIHATTDLGMLMELVNTFEPQVVIIDEFPTLKVRTCIAKMRREYPRLHIILFVSQQKNPHALFDNVSLLVDVVFYEPVLITELARTMKALLHE